MNERWPLDGQVSDLLFAVSPTFKDGRQNTIIIYSILFVYCIKQTQKNNDKKSSVIQRK